MVDLIVRLIEVYQVLLVLVVGLSWVAFRRGPAVRRSKIERQLVRVRCVVSGPLEWLRNSLGVRVGGVDFTPVALFFGLGVVRWSLLRWESSC